METHGEDNLAFHEDPIAVRADMLEAMKEVAEEVGRAVGDEALATDVVALCMELPGTSPSVDALMMLENAQPGSVDQALGLIKKLHADRHHATEEKLPQRRTQFQKIGHRLLYLDTLAWTGLKLLINRKTNEE